MARQSELVFQVFLQNNVQWLRVLSIGDPSMIKSVCGLEGKCSVTFKKNRVRSFLLCWPSPLYEPFPLGRFMRSWGWIMEVGSGYLRRSGGKLCLFPHWWWIMGSWVVSQPPPPILGVKARKAWLAERTSEICQIVPIQSGQETLGERVGDACRAAPHRSVV